MKKGSRHFYRRLLLVYTAILVGEVVLLGLCAALGAAVYFLLAGLMRLEEMKLAGSVWNKLRKRG